MRLVPRFVLNTALSKFWPAACALLLIAPLSACDSGGGPGSAPEQELAVDGATAAVLEGLQLTPEQQRQLHSRIADEDTTAGRLWRRAATLQRILTDAQKDRLFERWRERRAEHRRNRNGRKARVVRRLRRLASGLDLTSEQKQSLREVLRNARSSFRVLLEQRTESGVALDSVRAFRSDVRSQVKALLTPEQLQRWKDRRARRKRRRQEARSVRRDVLALSSDQREAMKRLRTQRRETRRSLRKRFWSGEINRPEQRRRMWDARRTFRSSAAEVLSVEQVEIIQLHRILVARHLSRRRAS